jgi:hypothetical protein
MAVSTRFMPADHDHSSRAREGLRRGVRPEKAHAVMQLVADKMPATFDFENSPMAASCPVLYLLGVVAAASWGAYSKTHRQETRGILECLLCRNALSATGTSNATK